VNAISRWRAIPGSGYTLEVHLDAPDGKLLGSGSMPKPRSNDQEGVAHIALLPVDDGKYHKIYFVYKPKEGETGATAINLLQFNGR
jgi:cytochrome c